jgi:NADH-quinone oxidoreductase subunit D
MTIEYDSLKTQPFSVNIGPQHPSTHGVYQAILKIDGEYVVDAENVVGYLHRGIEKLAESRTYSQIMPYTSRLDYLSSMLNNCGYVMTVEKLMNIEVPERAEYIRVIMCELQRIANHLVMIASFALDFNGFTGWMYAFADREKILDLFEMAAGTRLNINYMRIGGVAKDLPEEFLPSLKELLKNITAKIDDLGNLIGGNEIFIGRTKDIAKIDAKMAIDYGISGPNLRASGVKFDLRKSKPYGIYDRFDFDVPVLYNGDCLDRFNIRLLEIYESIKILKQAVESLPEGPITAKVPKVLTPPKGEVYYQIEGGKGLLGYYIVSDGKKIPHRVHIHGPSFINIGVIPKLAIGLTIQDFVALLASLDFVLGEIDR